MTARSALYCFSFASLAFFSCSQLPHAPASTAKPAEAPPHNAKKTGAELNGTAFKLLPPGSREYLTSIAAAFAAGDSAFLLAQGERNYARRVRPSVDPDTYAALLYRIGTGTEGHRTAEGPPQRIDFKRISGLTFTDWVESGPVIEVRARLRNVDGSERPCALYVLWKLDPPQLLGSEP